MGRKAVTVAVIGAVALGSFAGAAQVTREEFDALAMRIKQLEGKVTLLDVQVKRLGAALNPPAQAAQPQAPAALLQGRDLAAWKLAREAVRKSFETFTTPVVSGDPTSEFMRHTADGDYEFLFWLSAAPPGQPQPANEQPTRRFVRVIDLGTELRVQVHEIMGTPQDLPGRDYPSDWDAWR